MLLLRDVHVLYGGDVNVLLWCVAGAARQRVVVGGGVLAGRHGCAEGRRARARRRYRRRTLPRRARAAPHLPRRVCIICNVITYCLFSVRSSISCPYNMSQFFTGCNFSSYLPQL